MRLSDFHALCYVCTARVNETSVGVYIDAFDPTALPELGVIYKLSINEWGNTPMEYCIELAHLDILLERLDEGVRKLNAPR